MPNAFFRAQFRDEILNLEPNRVYEKMTKKTVENLTGSSDSGTTVYDDWADFEGVLVVRFGRVIGRGHHGFDTALTSLDPILEIK